MKRVLLYTISLSVSVFVYSQTTILNEDFGTGSSLPTGWSGTGDVSVENATSSTGYTGASGGSNVQLLDDLDDGILTFNNNLSTVGLTTITVLWGARKDTDWTPTIVLEYNIGSGWVSVAFTDVSANDTWALVNSGTRITLPAETEGVSNLQLRWSFVADESGVDYRIDDVTVEGSTSSATFYSKSSGNLDVLSNWGTNTDGSGSAPSNFTTALQTFEIRNRSTATIGANWTVSGASSKAVVGDGTSSTNFTIPSGFSFTGTADVSNNGTLTIQNTTLPTLGTITNGTIEYVASGAQNITAATYKNLTVSGSGAKTILGTTAVTGTLSLSAGTLVLPSSAFVTLSGTVTGSGTITGSSSARLIISGTSGGNIGTLSFTSGFQELQRFDVRRTGASAGFTLGSNLTIVLRMQHESGTAFLNGNTLIISEEIELDGGDFSGSSTSSLSFSISSASTADGLIDAGGGISFASGGRELNNLTLNVNTSTGHSDFNLSSDLTISGTLALTSGALNVQGNTLTANGSITGTSSNLATTASSSLTFGGSSAFTLPSGITALTNFAVNNTTGITMGANITVSGTTTVSASGILTAGTNQILGTGTAIVNGTISTTDANGFNGASNTTISSTLASLTMGSTSTVNYNLGGAQVVTSISSPGYGNLTLSTSGTKTFPSTLILRGSLSLQGSAAADAITNSSTVEFSGAGAQTIPAINYNNLTSNGSGTPSRILASSGNIGIAGLFTRGDEVYTITGSTIIYNGSSAQTVAGGSYNNLTLDNSTGGSLGGSPTVSGNLTLTSGTLSIGTNTLTLGDDLIQTSGSLTGSVSGSQLVFNDGGSAPAITTLPAVTLQQLTVNRSGKTVQLSGNITVGNTATITSGTLAIASNTFQVKNAFANSGTFSSGVSGTVDFNGTTALSGSSAFNFANTITSSPFAGLTGSNFTVSGNWTNTAGSSTISVDVDFNGSSAQAINTVNQQFNSAVTFSGVGTKTLSNTLDVNGNLTISAGTLSTGSNSINVTGNWSQSAGTFTSGTGTVILDGAAQNITTTSAFNNLQLSGSGTKSMQNALDVDGSLTISAGILSTGGFDINLAGSFTNNSAFTASSGKVIFDGSGTQEILGSATTSFNDVDIATSSSTEVESNTELSGTLTLIGSASFDADGSSNNRTFTLNSNASGTSRVAAIPGTATFSGNVTYQRYINGAQKWHNIGMPVSGTTTNITNSGYPTPGTDLGRYDETAAGDLDQGWETADFPFANIDDTRGYSFWTRTANTPGTLSFTGTLNTGNMSLPITYTSNDVVANDGWNLVNNPYASQIEWSSGSWTKTNIDASIYVWNGTGYNTLAGSGTIASGQSFWVHANAASPVLSATQSVKTNGVATFFRIAGAVDNLSIILSDGVNSDLTRIRFRDDATEEFDTQYDGYKLQNAIYNLSSITQSGMDLSINTLPMISCNRSVKLNITNINEGSYQLTFEDLSSFTTAFDISLKDNFLGTSTIVEEGLNYDFAVTTDAASYGNDRFEVIIFNDQPIATNLTLNSPDMCFGESANLNILAAENSIVYEVRDQQGITVGSGIGFGSDLTIEIPQDIISLGVNTFDVFAINGTCGETLLDSKATFEAFNKSSVPNVITTLAITSSNICTGESALAVITGSEQGITYEIRDQDNNLVVSAIGINGDISIDVPSTAIVQGINDFTVYATIGTCFESLMDNRVSFEANEKLPIPNVNSTLGISANNICAGENAMAIISGSELGITYEIRDLDNNMIVSGDGIGGDISMEIPSASIVSGINEFTVFTTSGTCFESVMDNLVSFESKDLITIDGVENGKSCGAGSLLLTAISTAIEGNYRWYDSQNAVNAIIDATGSTFETPILDSDKIYYVSVVNDLGCESNKSKVLAEIVNLDIPIITEVETGILLSSINTNVQWYKNGILIDGATESVLIASESGDYTVKHILNGCETQSEIFPMLITGIDEMEELGIAIYPNPTKNDLQIKLGNWSKGAMLKITDLQGKVYVEFEISGEIPNIDLNKLKKGLYIVTLIREDDKKVQRRILKL